VLMVWWPFAPKLERADTSEVTDLHSDAPPLYSTSFVVKFTFLFCLFWVAAQPRWVSVVKIDSIVRSGRSRQR